MKRAFSLFLSLALAAVCLGGALPANAVNTKTKSRVIHVVYDDSGSMANGVTSWSQAKYALEVFAAMMGTTDRLVIYPMSSYSYQDRTGESGGKSGSWGETVTISGTDDAESRVEKINQMNGDNGIYRNTPIQTVDAAGEALKEDDADEKWLVVLTDGAFDQGKDGTNISSDEIRSTILGYAGDSGIKVAYVAIGKSAVSLKSDSGTAGFYPYDADTDSILETVTEVATTVFNYQPMPTLEGEDEKRFTTDIPISKIIIFAQGEDVEVEDLERDGEEISPVESVEVSVTSDTEYMPKNYGDKTQVASGLKGAVLTYEAEDDEHPFAAGTFEFECSTDNVEVYYEPGVDIQAILVDSAGNELNLSEASTTSIEAGVKTVKLQMVNPLTGEILTADSSTLLAGAELSLTVKDEAGNTETYADGDTITVQEGEVTLSAKATFQGDIEKASQTSTLSVEPAQLQVTFSSADGYTLDPTTLETSPSVEVQVAAGDGSALTSEEYQSLSVTAGATQGVEWTVVPLEDAGAYRLVPSYAEESGVAAVDTTEQTLTVAVTAQVNGVSCTGRAATQISASLSGSVTLVLNIKTPDAAYTRGGSQYMFDCTERGAQEGAPYLLVTAAVQDADGSTRALSEDEWIKGSAGFSYTSVAAKANPLWRLIAVICHQSLEFEVSPGDEVSTYKLYLSGASAVGVRPNTSALTVSLRIVLDNGVAEEGSAQTEVTVMPTGLGAYIGMFLLVLLLAALVIAVLIMELRKKRFDRDMKPNTTALLRKAGIPIRAPRGPQLSGTKVTHRFFPPWKAEEWDVKMKYPDYLDPPVTFHCVATGGGSFKITDLQKFRKLQNPEKVRFDGVKYETMVKEPIELNINSEIVVPVEQGNVKGHVVLKFRKRK